MRTRLRINRLQNRFQPERAHRKTEETQWQNLAFRFPQAGTASGTACLFQRFILEWQHEWSEPKIAFGHQ